jgi:hypothetical protein
MITHDARWSLSRGKNPVPSPWQATAPGTEDEDPGLDEKVAFTRSSHILHSGYTYRQFPAPMPRVAISLNMVLVAKALRPRGRTGHLGGTRFWVGES